MLNKDFSAILDFSEACEVSSAFENAETAENIPNFIKRPHVY